MTNLSVSFIARSLPGSYPDLVTVSVVPNGSHRLVSADVIERLREQLAEKDKRIEELEDAIRPFAECDAKPMFPNVDPTQQFIYSTSSNFKETHSITLQHIIDARRALDGKEKDDA